MDRSRLDFGQWPFDLLVDYALKVHHRTIRREGPKTLQLLTDIASAAPEWAPVAQLFGESLDALDIHLMKEENVLFPYLYELYEAHENHQPAASFHCGSVANPIRVMMMEHAEETDRHEQIAALVASLPADSEAKVKAAAELKEFREALAEHIHVENDIVFPRAEQMEREDVVF